MSKYDDIAKRILKSNLLEKRLGETKEGAEYTYFVPLLFDSEHLHGVNVRFGFSSSSEGHLFFPGLYIPKQCRFHYLMIKQIASFIQDTVAKGNEPKDFFLFEGNKKNNPFVYGLRGKHTICLITLEKANEGSLENFLSHSDLFNKVQEGKTTFSISLPLIELVSNYINGNEA